MKKSVQELHQAVEQASKMVSALSPEERQKLESKAVLTMYQGYRK